MIIYRTHLEKIPENCAECSFHLCSLPLKKGRQDELKKAYLTKRHKDCQLFDLRFNENVSSMYPNLKGVKNHD